jgi:hypothetical protein
MYNYKIILNDGPVTRIRGTIPLLIQFPELTPILDRYKSAGILNLCLETSKGYLNITGKWQPGGLSEEKPVQKQTKLFE